MQRHRSLIRVIGMVIIGVITGVLVGLFVNWQLAITAGWGVAALAYCVVVWSRVGRLDAAATREHSSQEEPARPAADLLLVILGIASLFSLAFVLIPAGHAQGAERFLFAGLAVLSVALSWALLHTLFMLRYARLYYAYGVEGGINFNQEDPPQYSDFAYFSFNMGMTFQVSDTSVTEHTIRTTALRHALLSFVYGTIILATTINLVAGLSG